MFVFKFGLCACFLSVLKFVSVLIGVLNVLCVCFVFKFSCVCFFFALASFLFFGVCFCLCIGLRFVFTFCSVFSMCEERVKI